MKKYSYPIIIAVLLFFPKFSHAQRIAGYDIIGSKEDVLATFNKIGLITTKSETNFTLLKGNLQNEPAQLYFHHTPMSTQIYKVEVIYPNKSSLDSSKLNFNKRLGNMTARYGTPENVICKDGSKLNHTYNNLVDTDIQRVEWITMPFFQNLSLYAELLNNGETKVTYIVKNNALKYEQEIKMIPQGGF